MRARTLIAVLAALLLTGCSVVQPLAEKLAEYGIGEIADLAAGGRGALDDATARLSAIPDALTRIEAALVVVQARLLWLEEMARWLVTYEGGAIEEGAAE